MKRIISAFVIDVLVVFLSITAIYCDVDLPKDGWSISITYEEKGESLVGEACQLFYAEKGESFSQENSGVLYAQKSNCQLSAAYSGYNNDVFSYRSFG